MTLTARDLAALADAVVERLADHQAPRYVDAGAVAKYLHIDRDWVYAHQADLGAVRLGNGERARLRFDLRRVDAYVNACEKSKGSQSPQSRIGRPRKRHYSPPPSGTLAHSVPARAVRPSATNAERDSARAGGEHIERRANEV